MRTCQIITEKLCLLGRVKVRKGKLSNKNDGEKEKKLATIKDKCDIRKENIFHENTDKTNVERKNLDEKFESNKTVIKSKKEKKEKDKILLESDPKKGPEIEKGNTAHLEMKF